MEYYFEEIKKYIAENSYFEYDGYENGTATFSTRKNGNVAACRFGTADYKEAMKLNNYISKKYKDKDVAVSHESCDEWVILSVVTPREKRIEVRYIYQHFNPIEKRGAGSYLNIDHIRDCAKRDLNMNYAQFNILLNKLENMEVTKQSETLSIAEIELGVVNGIIRTLKKELKLSE